MYELLILCKKKVEIARLSINITINTGKEMMADHSAKLWSHLRKRKKQRK